MGLGRLNPGCQCITCGCTDEQLPTFSGWYKVQFPPGSIPGRYDVAIGGIVEWIGSQVGTVREYVNGFLVSSYSQSSPVFLSLHANLLSGSNDGSYRFIIDNGCEEVIDVTCDICTWVGRLTLYPPPPVSGYTVAYPGPCVQLCDYIPTWVNTPGAYYPGEVRVNPYSCVDCELTDHLLFDSTRPWPPP